MYNFRSLGNWATGCTYPRELETHISLPPVLTQRSDCLPLHSMIGWGWIPHCGISLVRELFLHDGEMLLRFLGISRCLWLWRMVYSPMIFLHQTWHLLLEKTTEHFLIFSFFGLSNEKRSFEMQMQMRGCRYHNAAGRRILRLVLSWHLLYSRRRMARNS